MKKITKLLTLTMVLVGLSACSNYRVPNANYQANVNLNRSDIILKKAVQGRGTAFSILPLYLFRSTESAAIDNALGDANMQAFEKDGADFVFAPKSKVKYTWALLFDYCSVEVVGKSAIVK